MSDRITTTCQHSHTVTLRLDEGEFGVRTRLAMSRNVFGDPAGRTEQFGEWLTSEPHYWPSGLRAELEAALAAAEASCGGCRCADRLRAEAERLRLLAARERQAGDWEMAGELVDQAHEIAWAAHFLEATKDDPPPTTCHCGEPFVYGYDGDPTHHRGMCAHCDAVRCDAYPGACLGAAPDARGSDLSAEQPAPVSEQGHAKKRAEWNDPKEATDG